MCSIGSMGRETNPMVHAERLADVINREFGTEVSAEAVLELFKKRWMTLSTIAHHLHDCLPAEVKRAEQVPVLYRNGR